MAANGATAEETEEIHKRHVTYPFSSEQEAQALTEQDAADVCAHALAALQAADDASLHALEESFVQRLTPHLHACQTMTCFQNEALVRCVIEQLHRPRMQNVCGDGKEGGTELDAKERCSAEVATAVFGLVWILARNDINGALFCKEGAVPVVLAALSANRTHRQLQHNGSHRFCAEARYCNPLLTSGASGIGAIWNLACVDAPFVKQHGAIPEVLVALSTFHDDWVWAVHQAAPPKRRSRLCRSPSPPLGHVRKRVGCTVVLSL